MRGGQPLAHHTRRKRVLVNRLGLFQFALLGVDILMIGVDRFCDLGGPVSLSIGDDLAKIEVLNRDPVYVL